MRPIRFSIVIPVYNEEVVLEETYHRLKSVMDPLQEPYELIFVNDGSKDGSEELLRGLSAMDAAVKVVGFSRNFGHQIAISAGIDYAVGDAVVIIDADLQDPPELIPAMIEKWKCGYEVVYGKRIKRKGETWFKRLTAVLFYRFIKRLTDIDIPVDTGDFRLMDRHVCSVLKNMREKNRFMRGLVSWVGFRQASVEYTRDERWAGVSKYPLGKMLKLSLDAVTSFSYIPLKLAVYLGGLTLFSSLVCILVLVCQSFASHRAVPGNSILFCLNLLFDGFVLAAIGILGEYVGRIYEETKRRPLYIVRETLGMKQSTAAESEFACVVQHD